MVNLLNYLNFLSYLFCYFVLLRCVVFVFLWVFFSSFFFSNKLIRKQGKIVYISLAVAPIYVFSKTMSFSTFSCRFLAYWCHFNLFHVVLSNLYVHYQIFILDSRKHNHILTKKPTYLIRINQNINIANINHNIKKVQHFPPNWLFM